MKEWICREISMATRDTENGILTMETELIRCKDCIYYDGYGCCDLLSYFSRGEGVDYLIVNENEDFCSKAERKKNDA